MPIILYTLSLLAGISCLQQQAELPAVLSGLVYIFSTLIVYLYFLIRKKNVLLQRLVLIIALFACGYYWAAWRSEVRLSAQLNPQLDGKEVVVSGVVSSLPFKLNSFNAGIAFNFTIDKIYSSSLQVPKHIAVSWYSTQQLPSIIPGQKWLLTLRLKRAHGLANPQGFDFEYYALQNDLQALASVRHNKNQAIAHLIEHDNDAEQLWLEQARENIPQAPRLLAENSAGIMNLLIWRERLRYQLKSNLNNTLDERQYPYSSIIAALTFGEQKAMSNQLWQAFNRSGVSHLFSVSGLHITMFAWLAGAIVSFFWRRGRLALFFPSQYAAICGGAIVALIYAHISGMSIPAERTVIMLIAASIYQVCGRNSAPSQIICCALLAVLILDPWAVMTIGFWLSFIAVSALVFVHNNDFIMTAPPDENSEKKSNQLSTWVRKKSREFWQTQWTATIATMPIIFFLFQSFSLVSPLANLIAIPVISLLITPLSLLAICLPQLPLLELCHYLLNNFMFFIYWCASWPQLSIAQPTFYALIFAALGVILLLFPKGFPLRIFAPFFLLPLFFTEKSPLGEGDYRATIFDVGQGLAIAIETKAGVVLFDSGPRFAQDSAGERVIIPWLKARGIDQLSTLIISHNDLDHHGGSQSLLANYPFQQIYSSILDFPGSKCAQGGRFDLSGVQFTFLHPQTAINSNSKVKDNHLSCVLKVSSSKGSMLITGDIEEADETQLINGEYASSLASDILIVAHHGSKTSSTAKFLEKVNAKEAIISAGYRNRFGHPHQDVLGRLESLSRIWRTDRDGAILINTNSQHYQINSWRKIAKHYWQS